MRKRIYAIILTVFTVLSLTACGSSKYADSYAPAEMNSKGMQAASSAGGAAFDYTMPESEEMVAYDYDMADNGYSEGSSSVQTTENATTSNRKLIKTVSLDVETKQFDSLVNNLMASVTNLGGYIENMNSYNGSSYKGYNSEKNANFTVRIPADKLDEFVSVVGDQANITNKSEYVQDITLQYVDTESHKKMLMAERDRLTELLEQAETVEDIITIEDRLTYIRYEIDSMESQLRTYDNQVDYSTVNIYVQEVIDYTITPEEELSVWERISTGFVRSLKDVGKGIKEFFIDLIIDLPYLIIWAVIIIVVIFILKALLKVFFPNRKEKAAARKAAKKEKKAAKKAAKKAKKAGASETVASEAEASEAGASEAGASEAGASEAKEP